MDSTRPGKVAALIPFYNEATNIPKVLGGFVPGLVDEIVAVDDGSRDATPEALSRYPHVKVLRHASRKGIGAAIRTGLTYLKDNGFWAVVVMAGNAKDDPLQIPLLIAPLAEEGYDFVQGSRYIKGGHFGNLPLHRKVFTRGYSFLVRFATGKKITDATNGFRAYTIAVLRDPRIDITQAWLEESLEYYLTVKMLKLGYKFKEVPVSKVYPKGVAYSQYTKVKPFIGWWRRLKPLFYLMCGLRK